MFTRFWYCKEGYTSGKEKKLKSGTVIGCNSNLISDRALIECVRYALTQLEILDDSFFDSLYADIEAAYAESEIESVKPIQDKIARITAKKNKLIDLHLDGIIDKEELKQCTEGYHKDIAGLKSRIAEINERNAFIENAQLNLENTLSAMRKIINQEESTPELYSEIIEKVLLYKNHELDIYFKHITDPICLKYTTKNRGEFYKVECTLRQAS